MRPSTERSVSAMKNMIDLTPYLPQETVMKQSKKNRRSFTLSEIVESVVTLLVGAGIIFTLTLFIAAV